MTLPFSPSGEFFDKIPPEGYALACVVGGLVFLTLGWTFYRFSLMLLGFLVGAAMGYAIGALFGFSPLYIGLPLGVALAIVLLLVEKVGAFFAGGLTACVPVFVFMTTAEHGYVMFIVAALAFLIGGLLTILLWKPLIIISLSALGATALGNGVLLIMQSANPDLTDRIVSRHGLVVGLFIAAVAIGGILFQTRGEEEGDEKEK